MGVQVKIIRFNTIRSSGRNHEIHKPSIYIHLSGWWLSPTPLKNGVKVSWGDEIPNQMESHNPFMFQSPPSSYSMGFFLPNSNSSNSSTIHGDLHLSSPTNLTM